MFESQFNRNIIIIDYEVGMYIFIIVKKFLFGISDRDLRDSFQKDIEKNVF